jgi:DNA primase
MREEQLPATRPAASTAASPSDHDWARWLRHANRHRLPSELSPVPQNAEAAWTALTHLARRQGFTVERANCAGADGFTTWRNRHIRITPGTTPAQAVTALAHQLGHVLQHKGIARLEPSGTVPCTGTRKVEADSVAYLTAAYLGLDTTAITFPSVYSWAGNDQRARPVTTIKAVTARILTATGVVTTVLDAAGLGPAEPVLATHAAAQEATTRARPIAPSEEIIGVHHAAAQFFRDQMPDSWVPGYLAARGLSPQIQKRWQTGYAPAAWDALTTHLRAAGYSDGVVEAAGLARVSRRGTLIDTFRDRAMLPMRSPEGTIIAFIGRARDPADPRTPKYLNSPSTSIYHKGDVLFGLSEAREALANGARPVIAEGPLDAIAVTTAGQGRYVGVSPCGVALTDSHLTALGGAVDLCTIGIAVAFDPDEAGQRAAVQACHLLAPLTDKMAAVKLPVGHDPAKILAVSGPAALAKVLATQMHPLPDIVINATIGQWGARLRYPEGQLGALRAAAPRIAALPPSHVARQVSRLAELLQLHHSIITEAVTDALSILIASDVPARRPSSALQSGQFGRADPSISTGHDSPYDACTAIEQAYPTRLSPAGSDQPQLPADARTTTSASRRRSTTR